MMRRAGIALLYAIVAFAVGAVLTYVLVMQLSSNRHDRQLEALATAVLLGGPFLGLLGCITGFVRSGRSPATHASRVS